MSYFVYIIQSQKNGSYYVGHTQNLEARIERHNNGGSPFTKNRTPWKLVYSEPFETKATASRREREVKKHKSRKYIERLVAEAVKN